MIDIYYLEEDARIAQSVKEFLTQGGCRVYVFATLDEIKEALNVMRPAVVLVDCHAPNGSGNLLCRWIRMHWRGTPVLFTSARNSLRADVNAESEDYVVKPFELDVLLGRIRALMRRTGGITKQYLSCDVISLDHNRRQVRCGAEEVRLSSSEYHLLLYLMQNKGKTVTRENMLSSIWDVNETDVSNNTLTVTVKRLREKLHRPDCLKTVRSVGYRLEDTE